MFPLIRDSLVRRAGSTFRLSQMNRLDRRSGIVAGLGFTLTAVSLLPWDGTLAAPVKILLGCALAVCAFWKDPGARGQKRIQILVKEVRPDRVEAARQGLLKCLGRFGRVHSLETTDYPIAIGLDGRISVEEVARALSKSGLHLHLRSVLGTMKYVALEASTGMMVEVAGRATAGSDIFIEGCSERIHVTDAGSFSAQIPFKLVREHLDRGFIPARCVKGRKEEEMQIWLSD